MISILGRVMSAVVVAVTLAAQAASAEQLRILTMGDSLMAAHRLTNRAVSDVLERSLDAKVIDHSAIGARVIYPLPVTGALGLNIGKQFRGNGWDWVVLNGGGNDLLFGCACYRCSRKLDRMISADGQRGKIPDLIRKVRETGARVAYVGYLRSPGLGSPIESCRNEANELERRISVFAQTDPGVEFLSLTELVPHGDRSYHGLDMIHPSVKGSREIALRLARLIAR